MALVLLVPHKMKMTYSRKVSTVETMDNRSQGMAHGGEEECTYLEKHLGICGNHLIEAKRHGHKFDHVPLWKRTAPALQCCNLQCEAFPFERLIKLLFTTPDKLSRVFHTD